uniref:Uncharacterized protein n=1 Tax=Helicotheca tamesis TaxID=374047 RepID=A0A7S2IB33_9STRA|mmetsp:Transcript_7439/g.10100  ORF Transcript_7439/g.10100 Transcript_7439/m.10100 type:complete len:142 (+) Transcript_7439:209-634(+)
MYCVVTTRMFGSKQNFGLLFFVWVLVGVSSAFFVPIAFKSNARMSLSNHVNERTKTQAHLFPWFQSGDEDNKNNSVASTESETTSSKDTKTPKKVSGYKPVEVWHEEYVAKNPEGAQVLMYLKQEKAMWNKAFGTNDNGGI